MKSKPDTSHITITHFHQVQPFLYRCAQPELHEYKQLSALNITTIFNLREELCQTAQLASIESEVRRLGMEHVHIPLICTPPSQHQLDHYIDTITRARDAGEAVLVHCAVGMDRTGFMIGAYRAILEEWKFEEIFSEMLEHGFHTVFGEFSAEISKLSRRTVAD